MKNDHLKDPGNLFLAENKNLRELQGHKYVSYKFRTLPDLIQTKSVLNIVHSITITKMIEIHLNIFRK